jgi:hypothetical protein
LSGGISVLVSKAVFFVFDNLEVWELLSAA